MQAVLFRKWPFPRTEEFTETGRAEREDSSEVAPDKEPVNDSPSKRAIINFVTHHGAPVGFTEAMSVVPVTVWAGELCVDEFKWRRPITDLGLPGYGESMNAKPVADRRAILHFDRKWGLNTEFQPARCEFLEVGGVREKMENGGRGRWQPGSDG